MVKLDVLKFYLFAIISEAGIVPSLFLNFGDFGPRCSFKNFLIKKEYSYHHRVLELPVQVEDFCILPLRIHIVSCECSLYYHTQ